MERNLQMVLTAHKAGARLVHAGKKHACELGRIMRAEDREEIFMSGGFTDAEKCVRASINKSTEAWAVYAKEDLLCVFGVAEFPAGWQAPWLLSSIYVMKHPLTFWRTSKALLPYLRDSYPQMVQMVHARYLPALRWVARLGFKVEEPVRFGQANTLFCRISMVTPKLILEAR